MEQFLLKVLIVLVHLLPSYFSFKCSLCQKLKLQFDKGTGTCMIWLHSASLYSNAHAKNCLELNPETEFIPFRLPQIHSP